MNIGMNFHSPSLDNPEGLRSLDLRWALFLADPEEVWNDTTHLWSEVKALCPRCEPIVRGYRPKVMEKEPEERAAQYCALLDFHFSNHGIQFIPSNEDDIESGLSLPEIAAWLSDYADAHRAIRPQDILHLPACSAGMGIGTYLTAMPVIDYDVTDVHIYNLSQIDKVWVAGGYASKVFVSEVGIQNGTPEDVVALVTALEDADFAWWKWSDKGDNPEGDPAGYAIANRPDVIDALARFTPGVNHPIQEFLTTEEGNMKPIYIACCYSLQDRNAYVPAGLVGNNEYKATRWVIEAKVVPMLEAVGIHARAFGDYPESQDIPPGSLSGLRLQMSQAREWLATCPADALRVIVSVHTDSGTFPHTFGIYGCDGTLRSAVSSALARFLADRVGAVFNHADARTFCKLGDTDYTSYVFWQQTSPYPSVLMELCSHEVPADLDILYNAPDAVAQALVDGILAYAGEVPPPVVADTVTAREALDTLWGIGNQLLAYPVPQLQDAGQRIHDYIILAKADLRSQGVPDME